ncbi:UTP--glucose-1-phosphate uridylyltransferase [Micromonospora sp. CPCC 206060]|uniref:UTP--glucose-1-phosphate uridylyltransferase n=1 Tax=Micromonospora sp. CPCC 206060 TaxID=3122406 RepID=UPI002FF0DD23
MSEHSASPATATSTPGTSGRAVKAVIPAAGLATRFLPATKVVPKELLPVVDRPVLQYIVEEAAAAGITDVLLITGRGKTAMVDHFDSRPDLEARLAEKGDEERLAEVRRPGELAAIYTTRQPEQLGLGHAVGFAEAHVGDEPFAVLLGDEFVKPSEPLLPAMLDLQARTGGIVLAFFEVDPAETKRYGIASVEPAEEGLSDLGEVVRVTGLVEKPKPEDAPSNLAVLGRYVLPGRIFEAIRQTKPGSGGEIQLTDAMGLLLDEGTPVHAIVYRGTRYDTGMPLGYLQTVVQIACERADLGADFRRWLGEFVNPGGSGT